MLKALSLLPVNLELECGLGRHEIMHIFKFP